MALCVFLEMIAAHEAFLTNVTFEFFFACMSSLVPREFVGSRKTSITLWPRADKRFLACKQSGKLRTRVLKPSKRFT